MEIRRSIILTIYLICFSFPSHALTEAQKEGLKEAYLVHECKGEVDSKEKFLVFQELRRRGEVPEFSLERCLEWGIVPPWVGEEKKPS